MRICTNCGHVLSDSEDVCSRCGSSLILDTSGGQDSEVRDTLSALSSLLEDAVLPDVPRLDDDLPHSVPVTVPPFTEPADTDPAGTGTVQPDDASTDSSQSDTPFGTQFGTIDEPDGTGTDGTAATSDISDDTVSEEPSSAPAEKENFRIVSVTVKNDDGIAHVNRGRIAAVAVTLLALISVILAVFMIVIPLVQARQQDENAKEAAYMDFLRGKWLSETFIYSGKEFPSCEILTVEKDGTFRSEIWTSPNDRETYDPETWTLTASQTGDLHLELETSSLRVSYTDSDGNVMVYRRYILGLDFSSLILREYYNETMTDYYDVVFSRQEGKN